jgi:S-adenosylmethionine:tRNA ribosyltransferase-isomerase
MTENAVASMPISRGDSWQREIGLLSFALPERLEAHEPPEARGLARDQVRLMVSRVGAGRDFVEHTRFTHLADYLRAGDLVVVNESATINAAVLATRQNGERVEIHFSQQLPDGRWVVELRRLAARGTAPLLLSAVMRERLALEAGGEVTLLMPFGARPPGFGTSTLALDETRLWIASVQVGGDLLGFLHRHGFPIRYAYVPVAWPLSYYQTIFATEPGSAEMPSAGRPFSRRVVASLREKEIAIAPILLHAGVASLEDAEPPYPEYYRVPSGTARAVNDARRHGSRIIAVGTTVVRALETAVEADGTVLPREGWTDRVITPGQRLRAVDALLTGFHEPRASHLAMLEALVGRRHLEVAYEAALREGYLWHEFGDVHLLQRA